MESKKDFFNKSILVSAALILLMFLQIAIVSSQTAPTQTEPQYDQTKPETWYLLKTQADFDKLIASKDFTTGFQGMTLENKNKLYSTIISFKEWKNYNIIFDKINSITNTVKKADEIKKFWDAALKDNEARVKDTDISKKIPLFSYLSNLKPEYQKELMKNLVAESVPGKRVGYLTKIAETIVLPSGVDAAKAVEFKEFRKSFLDNLYKNDDQSLANAKNRFAGYLWNEMKKFGKNPEALLKLGPNYLMKEDAIKLGTLRPVFDDASGKFLLMNKEGSKTILDMEQWKTWTSSLVQEGTELKLIQDTQMDGKPMTLTFEKYDNIDKEGIRLKGTTDLQKDGAKFGNIVFKIGKDEYVSNPMYGEGERSVKYSLADSAGSPIMGIGVYAKGNIGIRVNDKMITGQNKNEEFSFSLFPISMKSGIVPTSKNTNAFLFMEKDLNFYKPEYNIEGKMNNNAIAAKTITVSSRFQNHQMGSANWQVFAIYGLDESAADNFKNNNIALSKTNDGYKIDVKGATAVSLFGNKGSEKVIINVEKSSFIEMARFGANMQANVGTTIVYSDGSKGRFVTLTDENLKEGAQKIYPNLDERTRSLIQATQATLKGQQAQQSGGQTAQQSAGQQTSAQLPQKVAVNLGGAQNTEFRLQGNQYYNSDGSLRIDPATKSLYQKTADGWRQVGGQQTGPQPQQQTPDDSSDSSDDEEGCYDCSGNTCRSCG